MKIIRYQEDTGHQKYASELPDGSVVKIEGDIFGHFSLLRNHKVRFPAKAIEDTLIYFIPDAVFQRLCEEDDDFADFVELERPRLETAAEQQKKSTALSTTEERRAKSSSVLFLVSG